MSKIMVNIPYLEGQDINDDGSLKPNVCAGKPVLMMIQGNFCPHCTTAKPAFAQLAASLPSITCVTVQTDGGDTDRQAVQKLSSVNTSPGVPAYLGFDSSGRFKAMHNGNRDLASLQAFCKMLLN